MTDTKAYRELIAAGYKLEDFEKSLRGFVKASKVFGIKPETPELLIKDELEALDQAIYALEKTAAGTKMSAISMSATSAIIGYKIKNIGNQPILITRMTATTDHSTSQTELNPGQSICLNRAEMALLASKPEIGCTFANGTLEHSLRTSVPSLYKFCASHYFVFKSNGTKKNDDFTLKNSIGSGAQNVNSPDVKKDVRKLESPDIVEKYFIVPEATDTPAPASKPTNTLNKMAKKGIFNAFKR